jgi:hypothetical protein
VLRCEGHGFFFFLERDGKIIPAVRVLLTCAHNCVTSYVFDVLVCDFWFGKLSCGAPVGFPLVLWSLDFFEPDS